MFTKIFKCIVCFFIGAFLGGLAVCLYQLPKFFTGNDLVYYGAIIGGMATFIAVFISISFQSLLERKRRIPLLFPKVIEIYTEDFEKLKSEIPYKYFCTDEEALKGNYIHLGKSPIHNRLANAFCILEIHNMNKEYGTLNLSISIDGDKLIKSAFIKPNEDYKFILGFHYKIFDGIVSKEKAVCVVYQYMSVDMDQTFQQKSHFCFYIPENSQPSIKLLDPPISEREVIK